MKKPDPFEKELYTPRDTDGEPNVEVLDQIREIEGSLSNHPAFVALAPVGSTVRSGYSAESSGINMVILYNANSGEEDAKAREGLVVIMDEHKKKFLAEGKRDVDMSFLNINPEAVVVPFLENTRNSITEAKLVEAIAEMSLLSIGEKIKEYRQIYAEAFEGLSSQKQLNIVEQAAIFCEDKERPGTEKGEARLHPERSVAEVMEMRQARRELWKRRIANMWLRNEDARRHFLARSGQHN